MLISGSRDMSQSSVTFCSKNCLLSVCAFSLLKTIIWDPVAKVRQIATNIQIADAIVSGGLGTLGILWELLGSRGNSWDLLGSCGKSWDLVGTCGNSWELLGSLGNFWDLLWTLGILWKVLGTWQNPRWIKYQWQLKVYRWISRCWNETIQFGNGS